VGRPLGSLGLFYTSLLVTMVETTQRAPKRLVGKFWREKVFLPPTAAHSFFGVAPSMPMLLAGL
jgi:hypothetical protein